MSVIYFEAKQIDAYILFSFNHIINDQKIILNEIRFFENEFDLKSYITQNGLTILKEENILDLIREIRSLINNYLSGEKINLFNKIKGLQIDLAIDQKFPTDFSKKVITYLIDNVEFAQRTTYSEIGKNIGSKAYRAVGNILKKNPLPLIIPCHRVIRKDGSIGGFMGRTDEKWQQGLKKRLLEIETSS